MIKNIIYLSIIIIIYFCLLNTDKEHFQDNKEHFQDNKEHFQADIYNSKNCCVIRKKRLGKKFIYTYKKSTYCDNYHDNYLRTVKEGELINNKKFNMLNCEYPKTNKSILFGSCRRLGGFECIDFITKKDCKKHPNLIWNKASCNNRIPIEINYYKHVSKELKRTELKLE